jgi:hypothetical protein
LAFDKSFRAGASLAPDKDLAGKGLGAAVPFLASPGDGLDGEGAGGD